MTERNSIFKQDFSSIFAVIDIDNIDTDMLIPKQFLKTTTRIGLGKYLFYERRYDKDGNKNNDFVLNQKPYDKAEILVGGKNFGCGSSREHAPIAIKAAGVSCVIAKTFARIFYRNAINIGLPIIECEEAANDIKAGDEVKVDFDSGLITNISNGNTYQGQAFPEFMQKIIASEGLVNYINNK